MLFANCGTNTLVHYVTNFYFKIAPCFYADTAGRVSIFNAVNVETGEAMWIDLNTKVEVVDNDK